MTPQMTSPTPERTKVFVSYSFDSCEHADGLLELSNRLRALSPAVHSLIQCARDEMTTLSRAPGTHQECQARRAEYMLKDLAGGPLTEYPPIRDKGGMIHG